MVWAISIPIQAEYHRWYDEEHIAHLLAVPGFLSAGAMVRGRQPKISPLYELEAPDVLPQPGVLDGVSVPASTRRVSFPEGRSARNYLLNGYRQSFPVHSNPIDRFASRRRFCRWGGSTFRHVEEEFNDWYNTGIIPPYLKCPAASTRAVCGGRRQPKYLTLYESRRRRGRRPPNGRGPATASWSTDPCLRAARCRLPASTPALPEIASLLTEES